MADDPDVTVTDADMEDPELLAELAALTGGGDPPKPTPKPDLAAQRADLEARIMAKKKEAIRLKADKPACAAAMREYKAMEAQLNKLNASAAPPALPPPAPPPTRKPPAEPTDKDIAAVTVTDEDMDDPELLAELTALSGPSSAAECSGGGGGGSRSSKPAPSKPAQPARLSDDELLARFPDEAAMIEYGVPREEIIAGLRARSSVGPEASASASEPSGSASSAAARAAQPAVTKVAHADSDVDEISKLISAMDPSAASRPKPPPQAPASSARASADADEMQALVAAMSSDAPVKKAALEPHADSADDIALESLVAAMDAKRPPVGLPPAFEPLACRRPLTPRPPPSLCPSLGQPMITSAAAALVLACSLLSPPLRAPPPGCPRLPQPSAESAPMEPEMAQLVRRMAGEDEATAEASGRLAADSADGDLERLRASMSMEPASSGLQPSTSMERGPPSVARQGTAELPVGHTGVASSTSDGSSWGRLVVHVTQREIALSARQAAFTIGRLPENDEPVNDEPAVSGTHCKLVLGYDASGALEVRLEDASSHGTFLNQAKLGRGHSARLKHLDQIGLIRPCGGGAEPPVRGFTFHDLTASVPAAEIQALLGPPPSAEPSPARQKTAEMPASSAGASAAASPSRAQLVAQIAAKKKEALRLKEVDKAACVAAMREYKAMEAQLAQLDEGGGGASGPSAAAGTAPPASRASASAAPTSTQHKDLAADELELTLTSATIEDGTRREVYAKFTWSDNWIDATPATAVKTPIAKGEGKYEWQFKTTFKFDAKKRSLEKMFERTTGAVELVGVTTKSGGWFGKDEVFEAPVRVATDRTPDAPLPCSLYRRLSLSLASGGFPFSAGGRGRLPP